MTLKSDFFKTTQRLLLASGILSLASCATLEQQIKQHVQQPKISYKKIALGEVSKNGISLKPTFTITNPNLYAVPLQSVSYQLELNNKQIVTGSTNQIGTLNSNSPKDVTLDLNLKNQSLKTLQTALFTDKQINYSIKGSVNVMGFAIPFSQSANLYIPAISVKKVAIQKANINEVTLMASFNINNKNDFILPLNKVNYSISTGNTPLLSGALNNQKIIQGKNEIKIPLTLKTNQLVTNVFSLLKNPNLPITIKINSPLFNYNTTQTLNLSSLL